MRIIHRNLNTICRAMLTRPFDSWRRTQGTRRLAPAHGLRPTAQQSPAVRPSAASSPRARLVRQRRGCPRAPRAPHSVLQHWHPPSRCLYEADCPHISQAHRGDKAAVPKPTRAPSLFAAAPHWPALVLLSVASALFQASSRNLSITFISSRRSVFSLTNISIWLLRRPCVLDHFASFLFKSSCKSATCCFKAFKKF